MKKILTSLALALFTVLGASAQKEITALNQLSNNKAYSLKAYTSSRGGWAYNPEAPETLHSTSYMGTTVNEADPNQQFAILKSPRRGFYYFYSIGGKKFMYAKGDTYVNLTDEPQSARNELISSSDTKVASGYPWVACDNGNQFNVSTTSGTGVVSNWWDTDDGGNALRITEAADFDPTAALAAIDSYEQSFYVVNIRYNLKYGETLLRSYDQQKLIVCGNKVSFDAPAEVSFMKAISEQRPIEAVPGDEDLTVEYQYEIDNSQLPFTPTTVADGKLAGDTKWYFMTVYNANQYLTYDEASENFITENSDTHLVKERAMFAFVGDPVHGFSIYNMAVGGGKSVWAEEADFGQVRMEEQGGKFILEQNTSEGFEFNLAEDDDRSAYLNYDVDNENRLITWDFEYMGRDEEGSIFYFAEVSTDEIFLLQGDGNIMNAVSISPASGEVTQRIDQISIVYDDVVMQIMENKVVTVYTGNSTVFTTGVCAISKTNPNQVDITFMRPINISGKFTINIPMNTVIGNGYAATLEMNIVYQVTIPFEPIYGITGRVHDEVIQNGYAECYCTHDPWHELQFEEGKHYFNVGIDILGEHHVKVYNMTGMEDDYKSAREVDIVFDENGDFQTVNGEMYDDYDSYTFYTKRCTEEDWQGFYIYRNSFAGGCIGYYNVADGYGYLSVTGYFYNLPGYETIYIDFYADNRYGAEDPFIFPDSEGIANITTEAPRHAIYSLSGQRLKTAPRQGTFILDGKKVTR